jgi:hypothetical protein
MFLLWCVAHSNKREDTKNKNEIKFLYKKKQELNKELYTLHLLNANEWGNTWNIIATDVTDTLENAMKHKHNIINKKVQSLRNEQRKDTQPTMNTFHKRVENLTNITFTNDETQLLSKGLKYNVHNKHSNWIKTLAIEADTAISQLNTTEQAYMRQAVANKLQTLIKYEKTRNERRTTDREKQGQREK